MKRIAKAALGLTPPRRPLAYLVGPITTRDWIDMKALAVHGKFPTPEAATKYVRRHRHELVTAKRGRCWLVDRASFDRLYERNALQSA